MCSPAFSLSRLNWLCSSISVSHWMCCVALFHIVRRTCSVCSVYDCSLAYSYLNIAHKRKSYSNAPTHAHSFYIARQLNGERNVKQTNKFDTVVSVQSMCHNLLEFRRVIHSS